MSLHRRTLLIIKRIASPDDAYHDDRGAWSPIVSAKFRQSHSPVALLTSTPLSLKWDLRIPLGGGTVTKLKAVHPPPIRSSSTASRTSRWLREPCGPGRPGTTTGVSPWRSRPHTGRKTRRIPTAAAGRIGVSCLPAVDIRNRGSILTRPNNCRREPLDITPVWTDSRAHRATRGASDLIERTGPEGGRRGAD